jgi:hypothetical protein
MPNAIDPTEAAINIARFNKSTIAVRLIPLPLAWNAPHSLAQPSLNQARPASNALSAIVAELPAALTLDSIDQ